MSEGSEGTGLRGGGLTLPVEDTPGLGVEAVRGGEGGLDLANVPEAGVGERSGGGCWRRESLVRPARLEHASTNPVLGQVSKQLAKLQ